MRVINKIIIHHSDTPSTMDVGVDEIREWHTKERGWSDIGYHYIIRRNGLIELGRDLNVPGAHCRGYNSKSIGICLVGRESFTEQQWIALEVIILDLKDAFKEASIHGHNEYSNKTCPGFNVQQWCNEHQL